MLHRVVLFCFVLDFILFMRDTEKEWQQHREREKEAPCGEPEVELDPRTPGSGPEPKADAQPLSPPGIPNFQFLISAQVLFSRF